jgi:hypothetical protein
MKLTLNEWKQLKEFYAFQKEEENILGEFRLAAQSYIDEVIEELYAWFFKFDDIKKFFPDEQTISRVKKFQKDHFLTLTGGIYDLEYVEQRLKVGETHRRIGLPPSLYIGAYSFYMQSMVPKVIRSFEYDRDKQTKAITAFIKLIALDQALVLGTYFQEDYQQLPQDNPAKMKSPLDSTTTYDSILSTLWYDKDGILCSVFKNVPRTLDRCIDRTTLIKSITKDKAVCCIMEVSNSGTMDKEASDHIKNEIPKMYKALAIVTTTPVGQIVAASTTVLVPSTIPTKTFTDSKQASLWLQQYL